MKILSLLILPFLIANLPSLQGQSFDIKLSRPYAIGEKYTMSGTGSVFEINQLKVNGKIMNDDSGGLYADLKAKVKVLGVDELKNQNKLEIEIIDLSLANNKNQKKKSILPKGLKVLAQVEEGKQVFYINGKQVEQVLIEAFGLFFSLSESKTTDDVIFGTKDKKKVGDSWSVNKELIAKDLSKHKVKVNPKNVIGETKLIKQTKLDDIEYLEIVGKINASKVTLPFPPGVKIIESKMESVFSSVLPADTRKKPKSTTMLMEINANAKGKIQPNSPEMQIVMKMKREVDIKYNY